VFPVPLQRQKNCSRLLNSNLTILRLFLWLQMEGQLLNSLMPGDFSEHICVRVSRFWDFYDPRNEAKLLHSNLVLIDEEVCDILYMYHLKSFPFAVYARYSSNLDWETGSCR
jgi:hypothetical protein